MVSARLPWLLAALPGCAALRLPMTGCAALHLPTLPSARQHAHPVLAIGDVPPGFLGEDQLGDWVNLKKSTDLGAAATVGLPERAVALLNKVQTDPQSMSFNEVVAVIDKCFDVSPTQVNWRFVGALPSTGCVLREVHPVIFCLLAPFPPPDASRGKYTVWTG
jgi:hypothetical protein